MAKSRNVESDIGEPSTYQLMEKTLSMAKANAGETSQESQSTKGCIAENLTGTSTGHPITNGGNVAPAKAKEFPVVRSTKVSSSSLNKVAFSSGREGLLALGKSLRNTDESQSQSLAPTIKARLPAVVQGKHVATLDVSMKQSVDVSKSMGLVAGNNEGSLGASKTQPSIPIISTDNKARDKVTGVDESIKGRRIGPPKVIHTDHRGVVPLTGAATSQSVQASAGSSKSKSGTPLRRGKWTVEEEAYVARVIQDFNSGFLNAPAGTTLRSYLSEKLQCDPMRITKKFTGDACIGKRVFHPAVRSANNAAAIDKAQAELDALERRWRRRLEMQQRESAKKAAASAAASNASGGSRGHGMIHGVPTSLLNGSGASRGSGALGNQQMKQNVVSQAATWLDRANTILKKGSHGEKQDTNTANNAATVQHYGQSLDSIPNSEIENQMKEVQRLIYEGPLIQQTTAGLPQMFEQGVTSSQPHGHSTSEPGSLSGAPVRYNVEAVSPSEPADKRMRTASLSGAEDAEALVGFLRSVRASAASGEFSA